MNTPPEQHRPSIDQIIGQAPYRNGGLFNRYNSTVTEATPLDTEAVVRPGGTKYDAVGYELSG